MKFKGWQKTSLIEYPGKISTVLFTGECNFRCPFCYNSELVLNPSSIPGIEPSFVLDYLQTNRSLYQAVVVTGGEPTMHEELPIFFKEVKGLSLLAGLETNGTNPKMLNELITCRLIDFIGMDIKAPFKSDRYGKAAGMKGRITDLFGKVLESVNLLKDSTSGVAYEFRSTFVPGIHTEEDILAIAEHIKGAERFVLQQFIPGNTISEELSRKRPFSRVTLEVLYEQIKDKFTTCAIRNV